MISLVSAVALSLLFPVQGAAFVYPPDSSLSPEEYVRRGFPAPDRAWSPRDYDRAVEVLQQLSGEDPTLVPRFGSKTSGAVFGRLTAVENLSMLVMETLPIEQRVNLALEFQTASKNILLIYYALSSQSLFFDNELAEMMGFLLLASAISADCAQEFLDTLPADDPKMEVRLEGFHRMQNGLGELVAGVLTSITEDEAYRVSARRRLAFHLMSHLPRLSGYLTELQRQETIVHLGEMIQRETDATIREILAKTRDGQQQ